MNMKSAPANCPLTQKAIKFFTDKEILDSNSFMDNLFLLIGNQHGIFIFGK